jgi:hypothetical protein
LIAQDYSYHNKSSIMPICHKSTRTNCNDFLSAANEEKEEAIQESFQKTQPPKDCILALKGNGNVNQLPAKENLFMAGHENS